MNIKVSLTIITILIIFSCGSKESEVPTNISDLQFRKTTSAKEYSNLILRAIKTKRDKVVANEFAKEIKINKVNLKHDIRTYTQSIAKGNWDFIEDDSKTKLPDTLKGFDYTWYDQRGRIAMQIYIVVLKNNDKYSLNKIEFRSRLDILRSEAFPGGEIEDYKKIEK